MSEFGIFFLGFAVTLSIVCIADALDEAEFALK
jgi:hypothetical protein